MAGISLEHHAKHIEAWRSEFADIRRALVKEFVGKEARIISPSYNGQPYGQSRRRLMGDVVKITSVHLEPTMIDHGARVMFFVSHPTAETPAWVRPDQLELLEADSASKEGVRDGTGDARH